MTQLDKSVKDQIVVAAITAAGPVAGNVDAWEANVLGNARQIAAILADETSKFHKAVEEIEESQKFVGMVYLVKKEETSRRGLVYFQEAKGSAADFRPTYTYDQVAQIHATQAAAKAAGQRPADLPEGLELIRTERTDVLDGLNFAKVVTGLTGHRVLLYKVMEPTKDPQKKVRILKHVKDLGKVESYVVPQKAPVAAAAAAA